MSRIAIVHPLTLVGKELRERLEGSLGLAAEIQLLSASEEEIGTITEVAGAATFVNRLTEEAVEDADLCFFCGPAAADRPYFRAVAAGGRTIVLSSGATTEDGVPAVAGLNERAWIGHRRLLSPAPAAILLARLAAALAPAGLRSASATVILPVSGHGQAGLDALFEETRALLTFTGKGKSKLFASQVAFNLIPATGAADEIERQTAAILGEGAPAITAQAVQGGIFHAVSASVSLELESRLDAAGLRRALGDAAEIALVKQPARLGPVEAAGEERILVGELRDATPGRVWLWAAMDNLTTGGAINALRVAETVLSSGPVV